MLPSLAGLKRRSNVSNLRSGPILAVLIHFLYQLPLKFFSFLLSCLTWIVARSYLTNQFCLGNWPFRRIIFKVIETSILNANFVNIKQLCRPDWPGLSSVNEPQRPETILSLLSVAPLSKFKPELSCEVLIVWKQYQQAISLRNKKNWFKLWA